MERLILEWSIRALLLAGGTALALSTVRVRAASAMHCAWTGAMLAMLLLPVWTKWGPSVTAPVLPAVSRQVRVRAISLPEILPDAGAPLAEVRQDASRSTPRPPAPDWRLILLIVYLAGMALMLARLIQGMLQVRSLMRGAHQSEGFGTSPLCAAPVTVGWLRPVLLLPDRWRTWPAAKLEAVLTHEREHIRRRDPLVQWLALLNRCVFWFHPLAWWLERKLVALAEEACDAAVLAGGHAPHEYARYLIEIARSVNQIGARLRWAGAASFSRGGLPIRIRRIMDARPAAVMSRAQSIALAGMCALVLAIFLACSPGRRSSASSAQPTMSAQERQDKALLLQQQRQQPRRQSDEAVWKSALALTPRGAQELEADVKAHPGQSDELLELVRYYQSKKDWRALDSLTLWFIGEHPDMRLNWGVRPEWDQVWDKAGYDSGRQLWMTQLQKQWTSPFVYMNAAEFLSGNDNDRAEQSLLDGQRKFPSSALHWEVFLARHYAWALTGSAGQLSGDRNVVGYSESGAPPAQGAYAQKVREKLLASKDTELLTRTVEQLQGSRQQIEFARSLIDRVLSVEPDNRTAHVQREGLQRFAVQLRANTDPGSLSDADRMVLLQSELWRPDVDAKDADAKAQELLALASRNTKDPNYGTAIFLSNIELGEAALNRGDRAEAVRRMLAASEAPPSEFLRYHQVDLSLARRLVDLGERDAVATFLERCAKFNNGGKPLAQWAAQIRKGLNPDLSPSFKMLFRKVG